MNRRCITAGFRAASTTLPVCHTLPHYGFAPCIGIRKRKRAFDPFLRLAEETKHKKKRY